MSWSFQMHKFQMHKRVIRLVRLGGFLGGFIVLAVVLGACERVVYFWDDDSSFLGRPNSQNDGKKAAGATIMVAKGDTLYGLARRYGLVLRDLIDVNRLKPPYILQPGQRLKTPQPRFYTVSKGDTAYGIARKHGVDVYRLIQLNHLSSNALIREGQRLKLPPPVVLSSPTRPMKRGASELAEVNEDIKKNEPKARRPQSRRKKGQPKQKQSKMVSLPQLAGKGFSWPIDGPVILPYGKQAGGRFNDGINIAAPLGTDIRAAQNGVVVYVGNELPGFGNLLIVKHADGWTSAYAQCQEILVKRGQKIRKGQAIARVGTTGNVSTPQLHFELRRRAQPVDPRRHLI